MNTTDIGHAAEDVAAEYLISRGFEILSQNWKTSRCEIDIVAQKGPVKYFVECKYRRSDEFGTGLDYLTDQKLKQMQFAAEIWVQRHHWEGAYFLSAIELAGVPPTVQNFIPII
jgi:putative endonuclease